MFGHRKLCWARNGAWALFSLFLFCCAAFYCFHHAYIQCRGSLTASSSLRFFSSLPRFLLRSTQRAKKRRAANKKGRKNSKTHKSSYTLLKKFAAGMGNDCCCVTVKKEQKKQRLMLLCCSLLCNKQPNGLCVCGVVRYFGLEIVKKKSENIFRYW